MAPTNADRMTRFSADLVDSAAVEGKRQNRSARQQLEYWARIGQSIDTQQHVAPRRVIAAMTGNLPLSELTDDEGVAYRAARSAELAERIANTDLVETLNAQGRSAVGINDEGELIKYLPDGSQVRLD